MDFYIGCIVGSIVTAVALSLCRAWCDRDLPDVYIEKPTDEEMGICEED